ncbi:hypothetical protein VA7868_02933 [Vibrio aerogenes CECT 7868]|uniref:Uncharacterized protein n=1 Tax=Vibrio aerogenes CECT 7868 TaxID=1216006 RepID=A0A1M5ZMF2_9VIBR|nr:hypothetical protein [Vibrio aerogenes]SHI25342.1 hypothetical protein VA7868_02933 [Vibrio aerogenes CECT 7868]
MSWGSWVDDALNYGTDMLDSVGEGWDSLVDSVTRPDASTVNANTQPQSTKQADNHGNAVTGSQQAQASQKDKTLIYVGGGIAAVLVLGVCVMALKK